MSEQTATKSQRQLRSHGQSNDERAKASGPGNLISFKEHRNLKNAPPSQITFHRSELSIILRVYGFKVADGEWRNYAIDHLKERAVFSIFRRASEMPLYRVEKDPKLARKQGQYSVVTANGQVLKRGHDLRQVLRVLEKKPKLVEV